MLLKRKIVVSECVTCAHPDKIADVISDTILDNAVNQDPNARTGIEILIKDNKVVVGGEIKTTAKLDYPKIVRDVLSSYKFPLSHGLEPSQVEVIQLIGEQSPEINAGVDQSDGIIGAGDQGFCVGYASNTPTRLPVGYQCARDICNMLTDIHHNEYPEIGPDGKSQVVVEYDEYDTPSIKSVLVSVMHEPSISLDEVRLIVTEKIRNILIKVMNDGQVKNVEPLSIMVVVNPCGAWHIGGPIADCGLTGRKIVVDQFGGYAPVGGGAFSGKDMSKVDRSAAYLARFIANILVESGLNVEEAQVELSYMISIPEPSSFEITINGGDRWGELVNFARNWFIKNIDMTPSGIMKLFGNDFKFADLARYGHYGVNNEQNVKRPWEDIELIRKYSEPLREDFLKYMSDNQ